jgi:predicted DCC family thiol-disulfide oxidoreductase YuxK
MPANLVLMAKLIVLAFLLQSHLPLSNHFLPFFQFFDRLGSPEVFHRALLLVFFAGSAALFLNWRVRAASILLGLTILVSIAASRPTFSNNLAYSGALLFMIGLQEPDREPWLLRMQVVLLYFGAGLNKLLDPDWRSGQFFEYWFGHVHQHTWYLRIAHSLPPLALSKLMSWMSFSTELGLSATLLFRRLYPVAIWIGLTFHTGMLVLTNLTFQMYYFAVCASYLAFINWPQDRMTVLYDGECGPCTKVRKFFERIDLERRFEWIPFQEVDSAHWKMTDARLQESLHLHAGEHQYSGFSAFRMLLLYNPLTYFVLVVALRSPDTLHLRRWIALSVLLVFSPLAKPIGERVYQVFAHNRDRLGTAACARPSV